MMDKGVEGLAEAVVRNTKLPADTKLGPRRAPTRLGHGRYSAIKQQAAFDLYIECTKSYEATSKALAIR